MPKGGARVRSGPKADPNALRPNAGRGPDEWVTLPAAGRDGDPPVWPLAASSPRILELWTEIWALPQATQWERDHLFHAPALYVQAIVDLEGDDPPATLLNQVRQLADGLGLTAPGMRSLRWRVGVAARGSAAADPPPTPSAPSRRRLQVVADAERGARTA